MHVANGIFTNIYIDNDDWFSYVRLTIEIVIVASFLKEFFQNTKMEHKLLISKTG